MNSEEATCGITDRQVERQTWPPPYKHSPSSSFKDQIKTRPIIINSVFHAK